MGTSLAFPFVQPAITTEYPDQTSTMQSSQFLDGPVMANLSLVNLLDHRVAHIGEMSLACCRPLGCLHVASCFASFGHGPRARLSLHGLHEFLWHGIDNLLRETRETSTFGCYVHSKKWRLAMKMLHTDTSIHAARQTEPIHVA